MPSQKTIAIKELESNPLFTVAEGIREKDGQKVLTLLLRFSPLLRGHLPPLKEKIDKFRSLRFPSVAPIEEAIDHPGGLAQIILAPEGLPLKYLLPEIKGNPALFLEIAIRMVEAVKGLHQRKILHQGICPCAFFVEPVSRKVSFFGFGWEIFCRDASRPDAFSLAMPYVSPEQTGRTGREPDARSDLYSLGAVFYEMLCGLPPFEQSDPLKMFHQCVTVPPLPPVERDPSIPKILSSIIMKLLQKAPEERYQGAFGLKSDLEKCLAILKSTGRIEDFPLGKKDSSPLFHIPDTLLGRDRELQTLREAFNRAADGARELVMISGDPGTGKSVLAREARPMASSRNGTFISGKYNAASVSTPIQGIAQAIHALSERLLCLDEESLAEAREKILKAVGKNGTVLTEIFPALERITGPQPDIETVETEETRNRFLLVFQDFMAVLPSPERPLVLFLDDLQWADAFSVDLLRALLVNPRIQNLLVIGAYRPNETGETHPVSGFLKAVRESRVPLTEVRLSSLKEADIFQLAQKTFHAGKEETLELAHLVHSRTSGNPLFAKAMLQSFVESGSIEFIPGKGWSWSYLKIASGESPKDAIKFFVDQMLRLDGKTRRVLNAAACCGGTFTLETLEAAVGEAGRGQGSGDRGQETANQEPEFRSPKSAAVGTAGTVGTVNLDSLCDHGFLERKEGQIRFTHDRVRESAQVLCPREVASECHGRLGRYFLEKYRAGGLAPDLFALCHHWNQIRDHLTGEEQSELIRLNLSASRKARLSLLGESALETTLAGLRLLGEGGWETDHELSFHLHKELLEAEFFTGNHERAAITFQLLLSKARTKIELGEIYLLRISQVTREGDMTRAGLLGIEALNALGLKIPLRPGRLRILWEMLKADRKVKNFRSEISNLKSQIHLTPNPLLDIINDIYVATGNAVSNSNGIDPGGIPLLVLKALGLNLQEGITKTSWSPFFGYTLLLIMRGKYEEAKSIAHLMLRIAAQGKERTIMDQAKTHFGFLLLSWLKSNRSAVALLTRVYPSALANGDLVHAMYSINCASLYILFSGMPLGQVMKRLEGLKDAAAKLNSPWLVFYINVMYQAIKALRGETLATGSLDSPDFSERETLEAMRSFSSYFYQKGMALFILGMFQKYRELCEKHETDLFKTAHHPSQIDIRCLYALSLCRLYGQFDAREKIRYAWAIRKHLRFMKKGVTAAPGVFASQYYLMSAEWERVRGRPFRALKLYEKAMASARKEKLTHYEGTALEFAGRFCLEQKEERLGHDYLKGAYDAYERWGALAKLRLMEEEFPGLFELRITNDELRRENDQSSMTNTETADLLDYLSVLKSSRIISGEVRLERLLERIMGIVMENAGAERGCLLLEKEGGLFLEARCSGTTSQPEILKSLPLGPEVPLPLEIIHFVARQQETVILEDAAAAGKFTRDPYIGAGRIKSVLCAPLLRGDRLIGVLYLENNLASGVFTGARVDALDQICAQAAISVDNARMVDRLREGEEKLQSIMDNTTAVVYAKDLKGRYIFVNSRFELLFGVTRETILGKTDFDLFSKDMAEAFQKNDREVAEKQAPVEFDEIVPQEDGTHFYISIKFPLLDAKGKVYAVCGISTDITERKRAQAELEAFSKRLVESQENERKRIAAGLHDSLAQSLLIINNEAEGALEGASPGEAREAMRLVSDTAKKAMDEIRAITFDLRPHQLDQLGLKKAVLSLLERVSRSSGITIQAQIELEREDIPREMEIHLFRIIQEGLNNMLKHSGASEGRVELKRTGREILLRIADNGKGFDKKNMEQAGGFGLKGMEERVKILGGELAVDAGAGKGTRVEVRIGGEFQI